MANQKIDISIIRRILRLLHTSKSQRFIAEYVGISRNTVKKYIDLFMNTGKTYEGLSEMSDQDLNKLLFPSLEEIPLKRKVLENLFQEYYLRYIDGKETRMDLWRDYKSKYPTGYGYSQFREYFNNYLSSITWAINQAAKRYH